MSEICQYTVTLTREYSFELIQEDDRNMSNEIEDLFNPANFWLSDEETVVCRCSVLSIGDLSKFRSGNIDLLKIEKDELVEVDNEEEVIEAIRQEKLNKIKEKEFLKKQLKLEI